MQISGSQPHKSKSRGTDSWRICLWPICPRWLWETQLHFIESILNGVCLFLTPHHYFSLEDEKICSCKGPIMFFFSSVQFSSSIMSDSLQPHGSQHARPPWPSPTPRVHPNSCTLSRWCHPAISSSVVPFFSCPQSLPASESFPMSQVFAWSGQSIGVSASASVLVSFRMDWLDLLAVQGMLKSLLQHHSSKASILRRSAFFTIQLSHPYMTTGKIIALTRWTFVGKVMSLLFNMLSRLVITFLPSSKRL